MADRLEKQAAKNGVPDGREHAQNPPPPAIVNAPKDNGSYEAVCLIGYSLAFIIFGSQVSILGPTIKPLAERLAVDETDLSTLFTALGISCIISGTPSGWIVDRFPTHHVLIASLLVEAAGFALVPLMPNVWSLTCLYFVVCFSYNFTNSAVFTSLAWMFPKRAGGALNLVLAMFGVGSFFIPLAAEACQQLVGSSLAVFWVVSVVSVLSTIPFLFVASPQKPKPEGEGLESAGAMVEVVKRSKGLETLTTVAVILLVFFSTAAETAVGNWIFTFCSLEMGMDDTSAALTNSMFWAAFTVGRVFGVLVSRFTSPGVLLLGLTPFSVLGASLPLLLQGRMTWIAIMATAVLTGFGNSTGYANAVALLERYVQVTGFINGLFGAVAGGACMVGPNLVALLVKHSSLGYNSMAWVGLSFYLLHFPAILVAMTSGRAALAALELEGLGEDLEEPLLRPNQPAESEHEAAPSPAGSRTFGTQWSTDVPSMPIGIRNSYDDGADFTIPRTSLPGHVPVGSLTRQRSASHTWSLLHGSHHGHAPGSGSTTNAGTQSNTPGSATFGYVLPRDVSPMGSLPRHS